MTATRPPENNAGVVIIGAGQAGGRAAEALRQGGYAGPVTLVGEEPHPPYERPSLSKEHLAEPAAERIAWVRPPAWYDEAGITHLAGRHAVAIARGESCVVLADGARLSYWRLILATGARPRRLVVPGGDHPAVSYLRTIEDSRRLAARLQPGTRLVVVGAGYIGLEVAATARARGAEVTVVEQTAAPLARGVPPAVRDYFARLHRSNGVELLTSTAVREVADDQGRAVVVTEDGRRLTADAVVVGIGVLPNAELAVEAGLAVDNGIVVDAFGRTSDPSIYAAGDVTNHPNPLLGRSLRLESWQNAQNQAIAVARNLLGAEIPYAEVPWFWSDQFGVNLQVAGLPEPTDRIVDRPGVAEGAALYCCLRDGRLAAAVGLNAARDLRLAKEIIALGGAVDAGTLADPSVSLATLWKSLKAGAV